MNFPTADIAVLVKAVCEDAGCRRSIRPQSAWGLHGLLRATRAAGWVRNSMNEHRDVEDPSRIPKGPTKTFVNKQGHPYQVTAGGTPDQMEKTITQREMCFGITKQANRVINQMIRSHASTLGKNLVDAKEGCSDGAHYAPLITTTAGETFVLDWWMTLEIDNPIVWNFAEWKVWPHSSSLLGSEFRLLVLPKPDYFMMP